MWEVRIDPTTAGGCFIAAAYDNLTVIRFQRDPVAGGNVFMAGSNYWRSVGDGEKHPLNIIFDQHEPWEGDGTASVIAGIHWLSLRANEKEFISEILSARYIYLRSGSIDLGMYEAGAIREALTSLVQCQAAPDVIVDPFAKRQSLKRPSY